MNEQTNVATTTSKQKVLKVALLVAGLSVCAIGGMVVGKHTDKTDVIRQTDGVKQELQLSGGKLENDTNRLSDKEKERIINDIANTVERGLNAKYKHVPKNPTDDDVERIIKDIEQMTERELDSKYKHLADNGKESLKNEIVLEYKRSMDNRRSSDVIAKRIKQLQKLSNEELEKKAQGGNPYAQYALGVRINDRLEWMQSATGGQDKLSRLQKLMSEGDDYARYAWERLGYFQQLEKVGLDEWKKLPPPRPVADFKLLDYSGWLLLAAMESALADKMHWSFVDDVADELRSWSRTTRSFFKSPINKDPEFLRRWKAVKERVVKEKISCYIPDEP